MKISLFNSDVKLQKLKQPMPRIALRKFVKIALPIKPGRNDKYSGSGH